jgi:hypothetical protein
VAITLWRRVMLGSLPLQEVIDLSMSFAPIGSSAKSH